MISHDNIPEIIGVHSLSFQDMYGLKKTIELKRIFMEYVKTVRAAADTSNGTGTGAGDRLVSTDPSLTVRLDPKGFPVAPSPPSWDKVSKDNIERLYRSYVTHHYRMFFKFVYAGFQMLIFIRARIRRQRPSSTIYAYCRETNCFYSEKISTAWNILG